jgi:DNA methylase
MSTTENVLAFPDKARWIEDGRALGQQERRAQSLMWDIGDWWNRGEPYGDRVDIVEGRDPHGPWTGPTHGTCWVAGSIAGKWPPLTRVKGLTFKHHQIVTPLLAQSPGDAATLLQWCLEAPQIRSTIALQGRLKDFETNRRKAAVAARALATPEVTERYRLVEASVTALLDEPAGSLDLIVTDPPYPQEYLPVFGQLALSAAHVLSPGGLLICMHGQAWIPQVLVELDSAGLNYLWQLCYLTPGGQATQVFPRKANTFWKPVTVFCQGEYLGDWFGDVAQSDVNDNDKEHHHWGQSLSGMRDLMRRFVRPGHRVCDPFLGGGTTAVVAFELGASFLGFDINPEALITTRARLAEADDGAS